MLLGVSEPLNCYSSTFQAEVVEKETELKGTKEELTKKLEEREDVNEKLVKELEEREMKMKEQIQHMEEVKKHHQNALKRLEGDVRSLLFILSWCFYFLNFKWF